MPNDNYHAQRMGFLTICFCVFCSSAVLLGGCWMNNYYDIQWIKAGGILEDGRWGYPGDPERERVHPASKEKKAGE